MKVTPRYEIDNVQPMRRGMGVEAAFLNGYKHGFQDVNTTGICIFVTDSDEYNAWMEGYKQGEGDIAKQTQRGRVS